MVLNEIFIKNLEKKSDFLYNINYFRGIAIIFIVFGHSMYLGVTILNEYPTISYKFIEYFTTGGTTFFVFISGFLLNHLHTKNLNFRTFFFKKIKFVLIPYLLFSSIDVLYLIVSSIISLMSGSIKTEIYLNKIKSISFINQYFIGYSKIPIGLWYVPFIMIIFSLTKVYMKFTFLKNKIQILIIGLLIVLSSIIHRAPNNSIFSIFHNILYFTPVYLLGIFSSSNSINIYLKFSGKESIFFLSALVLVFFQIKTESFGTKKVPSTIDLMIFQKSLLCIFFMIYLKKFEFKNFVLLNLLSENSFGIFFIHGVYIWLIKLIILKFQITYKSNSIIFFCLSALVVLIISMLTSILIRKLLPQKSKYLIGC